MKKLIAVLVAAALFLVPLNAIAAVKAGASCSKLGATSTYAGKKYTCIKSGKNFVWNKGVAVATPKPTATPTPTVTPSSTATATPTTAPVVEKTPTSFSDLVENFKGIYISAWNSSSEKIAKSPTLDIKQNIIFGPNTKSPNPDIPQMFALGTRFFGGYAQPKSFDAVYYTFDDIPWASQKLLDFYGNADIAQAPSRNCQSSQRCNGASANLPLTDRGQSNFGVINSGNNDDYHLKGGIEIHEFAHIVQFMQFQGKSTEKLSLQLLPQWFVEGHAHVAGNLASALTLSDYKTFRKPWRRSQPVGISGFDPESIQSFYMKLAAGKSDGAVFQNVYTVGYFTLEALVALKGVDSPMELIKLVAAGDTFENSFKKVYGIDWSEAAPILAKTVSRIFLEP